MKKKSLYVMIMSVFILQIFLSSMVYALDTDVETPLLEQSKENINDQTINELKLDEEKDFIKIEDFDGKDIFVDQKEIIKEKEEIEKLEEDVVDEDVEINEDTDDDNENIDENIDENTDEDNDESIDENIDDEFNDDLEEEVTFDPEVDWIPWYEIPRPLSYDEKLLMGMGLRKSNICDEQTHEKWCIMNRENIAWSFENEWDVQISKLVTSTDNPWEYQITINVKWKTVKDKQNTWDICSVVVFDRSKSMDKVANKWNNAVAWAISFSNALLSEYEWYAKVWLVTFARTGRIDVELWTTVFQPSDFGTPYGWTNLHTWLYLANVMLSDSQCDNAKKIIVIISDWETTVYGSWWNVCWWATDLCSNWVKPSDVTIEYANTLKNAGIEIYAIWYSTTEAANRILRSIVSKESNFVLWYSDTIVQSFRSLFGVINWGFAWTNASITDCLGDDVSFADWSKCTDWEKCKCVTYSLDNILDNEGSDYTFNILINPDKNWWQDTNSWLTISYTDYDWESQDIDLTDTASIYREDQKCENKPDSQIPWIILSDIDYYKQTWENNVLTPTSNPWKVAKDSENLWACEWTCDTAKWYEYNEQNYCKLREYEVTFNLNGGSSTGDNPVIVEHGNTVTPISTIRTWYTFLWWTLDWSLFDFKTPITWNITLVAKWRRNWWWGGGGWISKDYCPDWDFSPSYYDWRCDSDEEEEIFGWEVEDCSIEWSTYSDEENEAYLYACRNWIIDANNIMDARFEEFLTRAEMAKIVSMFALLTDAKKPNTNKDCSNFAASITKYNQKMQNLMVMSCQLEYMWIHTENYEPIPDFMPDKYVSRAEFGTILSRTLWADKYEWVSGKQWYQRHLANLKSENILENIDPNITERRWWVILMIYRSAKNKWLIQ